MSITVKVIKPEDKDSLEKALSFLRKKLGKSGTLRIYKEKQEFQKPSAIRRNKKLKAIRRIKKRGK